MVLLVLDDVPTRLDPIAEPPGMRRSTSTNAMPPVLHNRSSSKKGMTRSKTVATLPPVPQAVVPTAAQSSEALPRRVSIAATAESTATPPRRPPQLTRQFTGVGMAPRYSRGDIFATAPVVTLDVSEGNDGLGLDPERDARRAKAARQRAARAERPKKQRGAHANPPLRSEVPKWKATLAPKTADAADSFDREHIRRWDLAESAHVSLSRDLTSISRQNAFSMAIMELMMSRYAEPSKLDGITRYAAGQRKAKPRKPWKIEDSIWGARTTFFVEPACPAPERGK